jgi:hypothetical protein
VAQQQLDEQWGPQQSDHQRHCAGDKNKDHWASPAVG